MRTLSFEDFAAERGISRPAIEHGLLRCAKLYSKSWVRMANRTMARALDHTAWDAARLEYENLVRSGEIRHPDRIEQLMIAARGHPDNASTRAARRILEKQGVSWE